MWPRPAGSSASLGPATTSGRGLADRYGLDALMPKDRRTPQMPEATPTHVIEALLTLAVIEPTIGCRQYADRLGDQGFSIAKSTVQKHLVAHGLGKRSPASGPGRGHHRGHDRPFDRGGEEGRALRVLPGHRAARASSSASTASTSASSRAWARCTSSPPSTSSPAGRRRHRARPGPPTPTPCASSTRCCAPIGATGSGSGPFSSDNGPEYVAARLPGPPRGQGTASRAHPGPLAQPQRRVRALPPDHPPRVLAPRLPSPSLHLDPPAPGRSRRLADHLPPPPAQPRRLHGRPHPSSDPRQPQEKQGSMTTINRRAHLSPRLSVRKP